MQSHIAINHENLSTWCSLVENTNKATGMKCYVHSAEVERLVNKIALMLQYINLQAMPNLLLFNGHMDH